MKNQPIGRPTTETAIPITVETDLEAKIMVGTDIGPHRIQGDIGRGVDPVPRKGVLQSQ